MFLLSTAIVQSEITGPGRVVTSVSSSLSLTCSTDSTKSVCWEYYRNDEPIPRTIYTGRFVNRQYRNTHRVTFSNGNVTLTLLSVQPGDSGRYQCRECSTVHSADIDVIVVGKLLHILSRFIMRPIF